MSMFVLSVISVFFYCFSSIFLPGYYSYNGTTALFMSANYLFFITLIYLSSGKQKYLKVDAMVQSIVERGGFDGQEVSQKMLGEVIELAEEKGRKTKVIPKVAASFMYIGTFVGYFVVVIT